MNKGSERFVAVLVVGFIVAATVPSSAIASAGSGVETTDTGTTSEPSIVQSDATRRVIHAAQETAEQEITECTTIDSPGRYVLTEDINRTVPPEEQGTCIEITSSNVVFDGSGGEIEGRIDFDALGAWRVIGGTAIRAENVTNVTIRDVQLRTWKTGIRFRNVSDGDIQIRAHNHAGPDVVDSEDIVFHDSVLRTTGSSFEADNVTVRGTDIELDSEDSGDIQTVRDGVRIVGDDGEVTNNTIDTAPLIDEPSPTGLVIEGDRHRVRENLIVGEFPTRRDPNPIEGMAFSVQGDNNTLSNNVMPWTGFESEIRGDGNTFENNRVNNTHVDVSGSRNKVVDSVIDGENARLRISGSESTVSKSQVDAIRIGTNASAVRNTVIEIVAWRADGVRVIDNTVRDGIRVRESTNGTFRNNSVSNDIQLKTASNNTFENNTADRVGLGDSRNNVLRGLTANIISLGSLSDNNTIAGSSADRIQVEDDSRNNTLRGNEASIRIAGSTSFDNHILGNNASGSDVGIELVRVERTLVRNNTVRNNSRGIVLVGASDNRLVNNTAVDNGGPGYASRSGAVNNTVMNLTVGPTLSFRSRDIALEAEPSPPEPPSGRTDVGVFINATNTSEDSWLNLTACYSEADAGDVEEETLRLWRHDGSWTEVPEFNRVDPADNTVSGNVSGEFFGVLAPLGNATDTTPPTISDYGTRTTADNELAVEFNSSERLSGISTVVTNANGDEVARLNESDFTESGPDPYTYTGTVVLPNGTYTATLNTATDDAGNDGASGQSDTVTIGRTVVQLSLTANRTRIRPGDTIGISVTRKDTGEQVNATVVADGRSVVTGADGQTNLSFPDPGTFEVTATMADTATETFRNDTVEVTVRSTTDRPLIAIDPASETIRASESFRLAVTYNATASDEVYGVQFTLDYDPAVLTATNITKGPYLGPEADTLVLNRSVDDDAGRIKYGESRRVDGGVSGNGTLAYVEFMAVGQIDGAELQTNVSFTDVGASDPDARRIETTRQNGSVRIERNQPPALSAVLSSTVNNVGSPVRVRTRASDDVQVRDVRLIAPDGTETDTLSCNTTGCNGTVSDTPASSSWNDSTGEYDPVSYRIVATDTGGVTTTETVRTEIYISGDANGDGVVDILDAVEVGLSWSCTEEDSCYSDAGDLNNDGVVDIFDAVLVGRNWQRTADA